MIGRRQLPVASPLSPVAIAAAAVRSLARSSSSFNRARDLIEREFETSAVQLTDSGTSSLVLALRLAAPNGIVAYPGYACVDLAAAALFAGVRVRLYDIDPVTLSPDLASVEAALQRGVNAIVVAHLFGYPADVPAVRALAAKYGAVVIEDAAQGAGGRLNGRRLGAFGDLSVLSFGRGKGLCAGGGGALLGAGRRWESAVRDAKLEPGGRGIGGLVKSAIQWSIGRPSVYAIPAMIPWLHLGEMVYHPASEPTGLATSSASLLASALQLEEADLAARRAHATALEQVAREASGIAVCSPIPGSSPGYLRYPVLDTTGRRRVSASLGIVQPYPRTLAEQTELAPALLPGEPPIPGATVLRASLFALPTHRFVSDADLSALSTWLRG